MRHITRLCFTASPDLKTSIFSAAFSRPATTSSLSSCNCPLRITRYNNRTLTMGVDHTVGKKEHRTRDISSLLCDPTLLRSSPFVDGQFVNLHDSHLSVFNPWDHSVVHTVQQVGPIDHTVTKQAVSGAQTAFHQWSLTSPSTRSELLQKIAKLLHENSDDLATLITAENGKPLPQARAEVRYAASFFEWSSQTALLRTGTYIDTHDGTSLKYLTRTAVGVVCAVTPWNFPLAMLCRKAAPALMAGCTVVSKPSEVTPLSALALAEIMQRAGAPPGVFQVVISEDGKKTLDLILEAGVNMLSFTGSTRVGRLVASAAGLTGIKCVLELGGNAPFVVLKDASMDKAVDAVVSNKTRCSGQTCVSANRIYVRECVYDQFVNALVERVSKLRHGNGLDEGTDIGPMISAEAASRVKGLVDDAVRSGALLQIGGGISSIDGKDGGALMQATVLSEVGNEMEVARSEIFGPVWAVVRIGDDDDEQKIAKLCNSTGAGLVAYVFGKDSRELHRVTRRLRFGMIGVNCGSVSDGATAFGGMGTSGYGREGGMAALETYTEVQNVVHQV